MGKSKPRGWWRRLVDRLEEREWCYRIIQTCHNIGLFLKHRPLLTCPFCKGKGGEISGYYEPEWSECSTCWQFWNDLEDHGWRWFGGRVPVWTWATSKIAIRCGFWEHVRLRDVIRCKLGIHRWMNEDPMEPGMRLCCVCYQHKYVQSPQQTIATPAPEAPEAKKEGA